MFERGSDKRSGEGGRMAGDDLQSIVFWQEACRLFTEPEKVECVAYSDRELDIFDDVVTYYQPVGVSQSVRADCYQVKFNMRGIHAITAADLGDPSAIGRTQAALIDGLVALMERSQVEGMTYCPILRSTWSPAPEDALDDVWLRLDGRLSTGDLLNAKTGTKLGKAVQGWLEHLGKRQPEELEPILRHFRISPIGELESRRCDLNAHLRNAGLQLIERNHQSNPYDDLIRKLVQYGHHRFDQDRLRSILQREGLIVGSPVPTTGRFTVGVRTFERGSEHMVHLGKCLDLTHIFEGRHPKSPDAWSQRVRPAVEGLVRELSLTESAIDLDLSATHSSIAFLLGRFIDSKSGISTALIQGTADGRTRWGTPPTGSSGSGLPCWDVVLSELASGADVAIALSATHEVDDDVRAYIAGVCGDIGQLISFSLRGQMGRNAIQSGQHAHRLADQVVREVRRHRKPRVI